MGYHLLDYGSEENEALRVMDSKLTARLLEMGRISPLLTFVPHGGDGACDSLLYYAITYEWDEGVALFMLYGGNPAEREPHRPKTALAHARENAEGGSRDITNGRYVLALLGEWPVDKHIIESQGLTALMYAAEHGYAYALQLLLQRYGANVQLRDSINGANALYYAMQRIETNFNIVLRRGGRSFDDDDGKAELDPSLAILIGQLDPVKYESRFRYAMETIRRHARVMQRTAQFAMGKRRKCVPDV